MASGIYQIVNIIDGKSYVGSAIDTRKRWWEHLCLLRKRSHHSIKLQRAWDKYGESRFQFVVLEQVDEPKLLVMREQFWIDEKRAATTLGYNICPTAGSHLGLKRSAETCARISESKKNPSIESRHRMSVAQLGKMTTERARAMQLVARFGKPLPDSTRRKIAMAHTGKKRAPLSTETKALLSACMRGRKWTPEEIAKRVASRIANAAKRLS